MSQSMRAGALAREAGINVETLRYYERRGLLPVPDRTLGGHRVYPPETVTRLVLIKATQRLGFSLTEIAELIRAGVGTTSRGSGLQSRASDKLAEVDARIADLQGIRAALATAMAAGCDDLDSCAGNPCCPLPLTAPDDAGGGGRF